MILIRKNRRKTFKIFKIIKKRLTLNKPVDKSKFHLLFEVIFVFLNFYLYKIKCDFRFINLTIHILKFEFY